MDLGDGLLALCLTLLLAGCMDRAEGGDGGGPAADACTPAASAAAPGTDAGVGARPVADFARHVILLVGDGVGPTHWEAARLRAGGALALDALEGPASCATDSLSVGVPTDSAAAATAMATGRCTRNGMLGVAPDGRALPNLFELARDAGKATGLVTNTVLIDATPMAFAAHAGSRYCQDLLAEELFTRSLPDVLLGGFLPDSQLTGPGVDELAADADFVVGFELSPLREAAEAAGPTTKLLGLFGEGPSADAWPQWEYGLTPEVLRAADSTEPTLAELTRFALERLAARPDGFVLVVENEHPDTVGHVAALDVPTAAQWMPSLVLELDSALASVLTWVEERSSFDETLVVLTSDHETGGYTLGPTELDAPDGGALTASDAGAPSPAQGTVTITDLPQLAGATFPASPSHTTTPVHVFARGPGSEQLQDVAHLSDIFHLLSGTPDPTPGSAACPP